MYAKKPEKLLTSLICRYLKMENHNMSIQVCTGIFGLTLALLCRGPHLCSLFGYPRRSFVAVQVAPASPGWEHQKWPGSVNED